MSGTAICARAPIHALRAHLRLQKHDRTRGGDDPCKKRFRWTIGKTWRLQELPKNAETSAPDRMAATLALDEPVGRVRLVSPGRARALEGLGIRTVRDLVSHYPRRYIDLSRKETVASAAIGRTVHGRRRGTRDQAQAPRTAPRAAWSCPSWTARACSW